MNPPTPEITPDGAQRVAETVEFLAKLGGGLLAVWAFVMKIAKPFVDWRRKQLTAAIRGALKTELEAIAKIPATHEQINTKLMLSLERQGQIFDELDLFVQVVADLRDRTNEVNDLLDTAGFASRDRRRHSERRLAADEALAELQGRLVSRRRQDAELRNMENRE